MFRFFKNTKSFTQTARARVQAQRMLSTVIKSFELSGEAYNSGKLIKISFSDKNPLAAKKYINDHVISKNQNSLFLMTSPTTRTQSTQHDDLINPGHNLSFITGNKGEVLSCMSKRPSKKILCGSARVPDSRFKTQPMVYVHDPVFTSVEDEISVWVKRISCVNNYPLYFHVLPLFNSLGIDKDRYLKQVSRIRNDAESYTLHSRVHPMNKFQFIRGSNCNTEQYRSVIGRDDDCVQDMFCQDAVMKIVESFVRDKSAYKQIASELGLTEGIESFNGKDNYQEQYSMVI